MSRIFGENAPSDSETHFPIPVHDQRFYAVLKKNVIPVPQPSRPPYMTLDEVWNDVDPQRIEAIRSANKIVFHSTGDTGPTVGPKSVERVSTAMSAEFTNSATDPAFFYHLGDVVYSFGEPQFYYEQFFEPYRSYHAPIFAIPGNHDGMTYNGQQESPLQAFMEVFCSKSIGHSSLAGALNRSVMTQPGVYFMLEAPFVDIIGLFSNVLESPGLISDHDGKFDKIDGAQKAFLVEALKRAGENQKKNGSSIVIALHHPPISNDSLNGGNPKLLADIDECVKEAGVYPNLVLSGHAHLYERFTRHWDGHDVPFIISGCGGHGLSRPLKPHVEPVKKGMITWEKALVRFGYLRITASVKNLLVEFVEVDTDTNVPSVADSCSIIIP